MLDKTSRTAGHPGSPVRSRGVVLGVSVIALLLAVNTALSLWNVRRLAEDARWVAHTLEVLGSLSEIRLACERAVAHQRTFLLTGDPGALARYAEAALPLAPEIARLAALTADNPLQQARLPRLRAVAEAKIRTLDRGIAVRRQQGIEAARALAQTGNDGRTTGEMERQLDGLEREERRLLDERRELRDRTYRIAVATGIAAAVLGFAALGMFAWALRRNLRTRDRAARALREQQELLQATLEGIGDGVIATDAAGRVTFLNPVAAGLTGWSEAQAAGVALETVFQIVNQDTRQAVENPALRALADGRIVGLANHTVLIARDGTERAIDDSAAPIRDAAGRVTGAVLVFRDVTERRQAERTLRNGIAARKLAAEELQEADRRKDEFLATLAHELRNPLAPVRNALEVMRQAGDDPAAVEQTRAIIERQVGQMVRLIDDLLDVSRITRNALELRSVRVDLAAVVQSAVEISRPLIESGGHRLTLDLPDRPVYLQADPTRLAQVFSNLLNNSAKYSEPNGRIALAAERRGDEVEVRVRDAGIGIPAEMLPRIFDPFVQADRTLERTQGGLGIGLTLVRRLVEMHGGSVVAQSAGPGQGSELIVRLPALPETADAAPVETALPAPSPAAAAGPGRRVLRVLVVDDNRDSAESLALFLSLTGHEVSTAHDGLEAVAAAESFRPQAVLLDIGLPKLNGYEAARRIREQEWGRDLVLVAVTGWGQEADRQRSAEAGFDHHLVKPVDPAALNVLLRSLEPA